jgi:hypothetical protein
MSWTALLLLAVSLACESRPPATPPPSDAGTTAPGPFGFARPALASPHGLEVLAALQVDLAAAWKAGGAPAFLHFFSQPSPSLERYLVGATDLSVSLRGILDVGTSYLAVLELKKPAVIGSALYRLDPIWVARTEAGWRFVNDAAQVQRGTQIEGARAELWISRADRRMTVVLELDVQSSGAHAGLYGPRLGEALRIVAAERSTDGATWAPASIVAVPAGLFARVGAGRSRLRLRYQGATATDGLDVFADESQIQLTSWLVGLGHLRAHPLDLVVHVEGDSQLLASMDLQPTGSADGWTTYRGADVRARDPALIVLPAEPRRRATVQEIAVGATDRLRFIDAPASCVAVEPVLAALSGILPMGEAEVHGLPLQPGVAGLRRDRLLVLPPRLFAEVCGPTPSAEARLMLAHELSHRWFGGEVFELEGASIRWAESFAEYVAHATVLDSRAHRCQRAADYGASTHPLLGSYGRGLLILTALEDRVGWPTMKRIVQEFVRARRGEVASWDDVVATVAKVAGARHADWLATWLARPGVPDLRLVEPQRRGNRLEVFLVQSEPVWTGDVTLAFVDGERVLASRRVSFATARQRLQLDIPRGARRLVLDPDCRLPRAYGGDGGLALE